jgi:hypothetical protein
MMLKTDTTLDNRSANIEPIITPSIRCAYENGLLLAEIRDRGLYRIKYSSFGEYCRKRWDRSLDDVEHQINAAVAIRRSPHVYTVQQWTHMLGVQ